ncbi:hypothetical protein CU097_015104, partial [Rhizopus azygosporus]
MSRRRKEADNANVEIARFNPSMIKITNDRTKLLIESKTLLDKLIKEVPYISQSIAIPGLQITGSRVTLFSLELGTNRLYVGVKEGVAVIPNHVARIKEFREVIMLLYKIKNATMDIASFLDSRNLGSSKHLVEACSFIEPSLHSKISGPIRVSAGINPTNGDDKVHI